MKKVLVCLLVCVMALTLFTACSAGSSSDVIKIGINYELSGGSATYGQSSVEGIEMAIDEINQAGGINGKKIVTVKYDNESKESEAATLANKLVSQDKVVAILGPATTGCFTSQIPVANKNKVPIITGSATGDNLTLAADGSVHEYVFRICFNDSFQGRVMANFAVNNLSAKKAVIIMDSSSDYSKGLANNFKDTFTAAGGTIVAEEAYVEGDTDFNAIITKIKGLDFDIIYLPGYYNEAGLIIKQARTQGIDKPILGGDGFDSPVLLELAGAEALNNVYFTNHYSEIDEDPTVLKFISDFEARYGKKPNAFNALGYDLAKFVADAISRAENLSGEAIKNALADTENFAGVTGTLSVDEKHNPVKSIFVIELKDGVQHSSVKVNP
ncbi:high-affinity branched-chain amino acid ABC transporter systemsubstrate binding protein LivK [Thermoclostridium stercorarium subsp. stercorarium DSM 8532]|jgi:branched-chain amino acid transport system substrate-binding protein|uniref:High-affinity branched-chain amino acid ABC transporter systemsubstrate binding protein LivK n=3 Tax=Thermoclostridium stercorarium TaxID=1510 RepID=L7VNG0_THES1|nr:ABC transporter substrate-binding protein [Thermoclostridium stercorarium]AGC68001.1 high-affinity branched-chain amino acid ABC transporter systemsubstrate binding protein LivK [Thermoclostridium stercorarium subsp. stercorarium DSM 8532]AGI39036.1 ABC transporter periplasmic subunit [Thermoclostridium stercorarium subsp. stercorarium DSM 8532]ANW98402.1 ethanolamine utilization protein EutJ [Thermoclostridium stercorarium subsp. thermolacticum DSM 2910]ANX00938.1 ethanolamine utilization p